MKTSLRIAAACLCLSFLGAVRMASAADTQKPPKALGAVDEFAENFFDYAKGQKWEKATPMVADLKKDAASLAADLKDEKVKAALARHVAAVDRAVSKKDRVAAMRASNQITLLTAKIGAAYPHRVPTEVAMIDFYGREVELWSIAKEDKKLKSSSAALQETWMKVRPAVIASDGQEMAKKFDGMVDKLKAATSPDECLAAAGPILDGVDDLEDLFNKKK